MQVTIILYDLCCCCCFLLFVLLLFIYCIFCLWLVQVTAQPGWGENYHSLIYKTVWLLDWHLSMHKVNSACTNRCSTKELYYACGKQKAALKSCFSLIEFLACWISSFVVHLSHSSYLSWESVSASILYVHKTAKTGSVSWVLKWEVDSCICHSLIPPYGA